MLEHASSDIIFIASSDIIFIASSAIIFIASSDIIFISSSSHSKGTLDLTGKLVQWR